MGHNIFIVQNRPAISRSTLTSTIEKACINKYKQAWKRYIPVILDHTETTMALAHTVATITFDNIIAFDTIVAFYSLRCAADVIARDVA
jgi:hypothetical protein